MSQLKEGPEMKKSILTLLVAFTMAGLAVPVANAGQSQQAIIREKLGEIGAWAVPSPTQNAVSSKPQTGQSQQAIIREKLGEIGAWAVPSPTQNAVSSKPQTGQSQQAIIREKLGEIGAWAVPSRSTGPVASSGDGFDWNDAGLGVAFAFGIILVGTAGVVTIRRYHGPIAH
jgi:hypothetical protein